MATRTFYVTRDTRHPLYKTRMLTAGQELPLSGSAAKLFRDLGVELSDEAPRKAVKVEAPAPVAAARPVDGQGSFSDEREAAPKPAATKAAPKKAARRKKSK